MIITTLVENTQHNHDTDLSPEPGLSLHVSFAGMQILFDMRIYEAFSWNASRLGVDLGAVQTAVLSHHHFDHGGGLPRFIGLNSDAKVHLRKPPDGEPYFKGLLAMRKRVGLEAGLLESNIDRFAIVHEPIRISDGVHQITFPIFNSMAGTRRQVEALGRQLLSLPVDCYYTGHCTGRKAYGVLQPDMGARLQPLHTGTVIEL